MAASFVFYLIRTLSIIFPLRRFNRLVELCKKKRNDLLPRTDGTFYSTYVDYIPLQFFFLSICRYVSVSEVQNSGGG